MPSKRLSAVFTAIFTVAVLVAGTRAAAQIEGVLHSFNSAGEGGNFPHAGLILDASGNLYGVAGGGAHNAGAVFELSPKTGGGFTEKLLHSFNNNGKDGNGPWASLIFDSAGNLYGTTIVGGAYNSGTVFELSPSSSGGWSEKILHAFNNNGKDGTNPVAALIFDAAGNLYGTTEFGGTGPCTDLNGDLGCGTVFELATATGGRWSERVLHSFGSDPDGEYPLAGLIRDSAGNLYGTTAYGGSDSNCYLQSNGIYGCGTVFELISTTGGQWKEKILHDFNLTTDGWWPLAGLTSDAAGNLYGTTVQSGDGYCQTSTCGTVFELTPALGGIWTESILHNFSENGTDGFLPYGGVILDVATGNLYGTTSAGGVGLCYGGCGTVFALTSAAGGTWTETILHSFLYNSTDGREPEAGLVFDQSGNLLGTTYLGGNGANCALGCGTVFKVRP